MGIEAGLFIASVDIDNERFFLRSQIKDSVREVVDAIRAEVELELALEIIH